MDVTSNAEKKPTSHEIHQRAEALFQKSDWEALTALSRLLPAELDSGWARVADQISFALGQQKRFPAAIELLLRTWEVEGTYRRASALAYQHYAASLELPGQQRARKRRGGQPAGADEATDRAKPLDREALREGFRRWIAEALALAPGSVKDLYRLGVFEAQVESAHDKVALRALLGAVDAYRSLNPAERERRHDLRKYFIRALYAGARSALRLGQVRLARKLSFACIREDEKRNHVAPVHKLGLAGKICFTGGDLDVAERAVRLALDAKGPPNRQHLFQLMARIDAQRGQLDSAVSWIDRNVRPHQRSAATWRLLGDLLARQEKRERAQKAYRSALDRDRLGRHLTLVRLGDLSRDSGDLRAAERCYREALQFRRRRYSSDDPAALERLAGIEAMKPVGPGVTKTQSPRDEAAADEGSTRAPKRASEGGG